jgi:hypothetical protein
VAGQAWHTKREQSAGQPPPLTRRVSTVTASGKMMGSRSNFDHMTTVVPTLSMHMQKAV